jgi:DNA processing protein
LIATLRDAAGLLDVPLSVRLDPASAAWPIECSAIDLPPAELWAEGELEHLGRRPRVAIVGTRAPTPYGIEQSRRFSSALARRGCVIVSGLARGIDEAAHLAALDAGGATIGVLGSGLDRVWPQGALADRMRAEGLLLTEHPPGVAPRRHHFPLRNRLISGLSSAVVVIEAAFASGSLITARWAIDQGRAVFAVPGRVDHPMARGCHRLLSDGAEFAQDPGDVLAVLGLEPTPDAAAPVESGPEPTLLAALCGETLTADELAERTGLSLPRVLAELVSFELDGRVARSPGGLFRRASRDH